VRKSQPLMHRKTTHNRKQGEAQPVGQTDGRIESREATERGMPTDTGPAATERAWSARV